MFRIETAIDQELKRRGYDRCELCSGSGRVFGPHRCSACNGKGYQTENDKRRWKKLIEKYDQEVAPIWQEDAKTTEILEKIRVSNVIVMDDWSFCERATRVLRRIS